MESKQVKFFQICASDHYLFGLDGEGRVWRRYLLELDAKWMLFDGPFPQES